MQFFSTINAVYVIFGSMLLGICAGVLGVFAVLRKQGLLGDALSHASLPGIALAFLVMKTKFLPVLILGALISGLLASYSINLLVTKSKIKMDSAMAGVLSIFFGFGIFLLTYIQHLSISSQAGLDTFLFGQAAALLKSDIVWMSVIFVLIITVVVVFWKELKVFIFDPDYAKVMGFKKSLLETLFMSVFVMSILMSLQAVGVVLTAALFVIPAVTALFWTNRLLFAVLISGFCGMLSGGTGAYLSSLYDNLPTGPVIVVVAALFFFISFLFSPGKGLVYRWQNSRKHSLNVQIENLLARFYRDTEKNIDLWSVDECLENGCKKSILNYLKNHKLLEIVDGQIILTKAGKLSGAEVVHKHRLWETYLVNELRLAPDHVHRDAESMEHILTKDMIKKLERILEYPKVDPHGKPINNVK